MVIISYPEKTAWTELLKRPVMNDRDVDSIVLPIINDVKNRGDMALREYTTRFDGVVLSSLEVSEEEFREAEAGTDEQLKKAIQTAMANIEVFHRAQQLKTVKITTTEGVVCWQKSLPIEKVGLYIPGGTAPLFSTLLMLGIPAVLAAPARRDHRPGEPARLPLQPGRAQSGDLPAADAKQQHGHTAVQRLRAGPVHAWPVDAVGRGPVGSGQQLRAGRG